MTLKDAVEKALTPKILASVREHLSPPEILKIAALECFLHNQEDGVADRIRASLIILDETGLMDEKI